MDSCCGESCECEESSMTEMVLALADEAWAELLKEKIKKEFDKQNGAKMDKIATVAVKAGMAMWQQKMKGEGDVESILKELDTIMQ